MNKFIYKGKYYEVGESGIYLFIGKSTFDTAIVLSHAANDTKDPAPEKWQNFGNDLYHSVISEKMAEMKGRLVFLSTMNPIVMDYFPIASWQDLQSRLFVCEADRDELRISNEDAIRCFEAYEAGIETLGQILETRSIW